MFSAKSGEGIDMGGACKMLYTYDCHINKTCISKQAL